MGPSQALALARCAMSRILPSLTRLWAVAEGYVMGREGVAGDKVESELLA
jgi:hypothetical protein